MDKVSEDAVRALRRLVDHDGFPRDLADKAAIILAGDLLDRIELPPQEEPPSQPRQAPRGRPAREKKGRDDAQRAAPEPAAEEPPSGSPGPAGGDD